MLDKPKYQLLSKEEDELHSLRCTKSDCDNRVHLRRNGQQECHCQVKSSTVWVAGSCFILLTVTALAMIFSLWKGTPRDMLNYCETHILSRRVSMGYG